MADSTQPDELSPEDRPAPARKCRASRTKTAEKNRERERARYWSDPEKYRALNQKSAKRNRAKNTAREREWRKNNKDRVRGYYLRHVKKKLSQDPLFRLQQNIRTRVCAVLSRSGLAKTSRTMKLVGCTPDELRKYIEGKFLPGMTWENRGRHGWHIDHIIPLAKFDLSDSEQQAAAFHYTNLQPLWAKDNLRKSDKVAGQQCFGFAYADRIADAASTKPKRRRKRGGLHGDH